MNIPEVTLKLFFFNITIRGIHGEITSVYVFGVNFLNAKIILAGRMYLYLHYNITITFVWSTEWNKIVCEYTGSLVNNFSDTANAFTNSKVRHISFKLLDVHFLPIISR